ncbi:thiopurine S-methyltransferase [Parasalinivibrio latis]|uniref:thiopurine S-methyltransferase n=1 Tax=Parasalinivibrio latis TaxID=2952610 RepID=UPI0030E54811
MVPEFWHQRWAENRIGFHLDDVNSYLKKHWQALAPKRDERVFVPLSGKSLDLVWLAQKHNEVAGVELSEIAVRAFFAEQLYTPTVYTQPSGHEVYEFDEITLYCGDYFTLNAQPFSLVYDRAALIAMPPEMRKAYVEKLRSMLLPGARIMLVTLDYPQHEGSGPPFAVPESEVRELFAGMEITCLERNEEDAKQPRNMKYSHFAEEVWLIKNPE